MSDLKQLYQEIVLDHYRKPRNFGVLEGADREAAGHNPLCGDRVKVYLGLDGERIEEIRFEGAGCAISTASASLMTSALAGKTLEEARDLGEHFRAMITSKEDVGTTDLGELEALQGVRDLPVRVKCATLAWHTLQAALDQQDEPVSTE